MRSLLSKGEIKVIRLMVEGLKAREIADKMGLSFRTVENRKMNMYKKLGVTSPISFIRKVVRLNIDGIGDEFLHDDIEQPEKAHRVRLNRNQTTGFLDEDEEERTEEEIQQECLDINEYEYNRPQEPIQ